MDEVNRRGFLKKAAVAAAVLGVETSSGCREAPDTPPVKTEPAPLATQEVKPVTVTTMPLQMPWQTEDPFLFCVHHLDVYPKGNSEMGPAASLAGRQMGRDFSGRDGWSMYHGQVVPGFPRHPHRGFETVTVTRQGMIDHSDSLGATARYGEGDVQWMTAGRGIVHAEMFPLRRQESANPAELFQIWLNLPARSKFTEPYFTMFWHEAIPVHRLTDTNGLAVTVTTITGTLDNVTTPCPPPESWAAQPETETAIWTIDLAAGARWTVPAASSGLTRTLYVYRGDVLDVAGTPVLPGHRATVASDRAVELAAGNKPCQLLLLQGRPIGEPVVQHGPFVMNNAQEIRQAYRDYQRDGFGSWPWDRDDPVHSPEQGRFARHVDGRTDKPA